MEVLLPSIEVLERFSDELRVEITKSKELIEKVWRRVTSLFNVVVDEAKRVLPRVEFFYSAESLVDVNFIVGGACSTLPLTWDTSSLRLALIEFARP